MTVTTYDRASGTTRQSKQRLPDEKTMRALESQNSRLKYENVRLKMKNGLLRRALGAPLWVAGGAARGAAGVVGGTARVVASPFTSLYGSLSGDKQRKQRDADAAARKLGWSQQYASYQAEQRSQAAIDELRYRAMRSSSSRRR